MRIPEAVAAAFNPSHLRLIVLPTEKCNFRCTYCYESFEIGRMSDDTAAALVRHIRARSGSLKSLHISWFGGEPLLARDVVLHVSSAAAEICNNEGIRFQSDMTTNAWLLDFNTASELRNVGVTEYQITLDGLQADHDSTRRVANGSGSYARIHENLSQLRDSNLDIRVLLRLHYSGRTVASLREFAREVASTFAHDHRFSFSLREIEALGGPNDASLVHVSSPSEVALVREAELILDPMASTRSPAQSSFCYAGAANAYVVRADGSLAKCTVAFSDSRNHIGRLNADGTFALDHAKAIAWTASAMSGKDGAEECPLHHLSYPDSVVVKYLRTHR